MDINRIVAETFVSLVDYHDELASTNTRALELARELPEIPQATLVIAERQTAGRGRGDNRWWSGEGGLALSVLLDCAALGLQPSRWPMISLSVGLSVCEAIEQQVSGAQAYLKWPNDVYLCGCKVCGILVEVPDSRRARVVIGIGINVNNGAAQVPLELRGFTISLSDLAQRKLAPEDILIQVLQHLDARLENLAAGALDLQSQWQSRCLLTGRRIVIDQERGQLTGLCHGIDQDGALLVETGLGIERCLSGSIVEFSKKPA